MALDKEGLKNDIKAISNILKEYDGSPSKTQEDAINKHAELLAEAIEKYVKTGVVQCTPAQVSSAIMSAGGYPVVAGNNLNGTIG